MNYSFAFFKAQLSQTGNKITAHNGYTFFPAFFSVLRKERFLLPRFE